MEATPPPSSSSYRPTTVKGIPETYLVSPSGFTPKKKVSTNAEVLEQLAGKYPICGKVLEYNIYQVAAILPRMDEIIYFGDDLGMQRGLAIGAERWRKYLKPCFRKLYGMIKTYKPDQIIYMHTDGCIWEIMPDLIECGVDIINPQFRANGLDNLVRVCRKEQIIPINLDLDRQLFPVATRSQIFDHVAECV